MRASDYNPMEAQAKAQIGGLIGATSGYAENEVSETFTSALDRQLQRINSILSMAIVNLERAQGSPSAPINSAGQEKMQPQASFVTIGEVVQKIENQADALFNFARRI